MRKKSKYNFQATLLKNVILSKKFYSLTKAKDEKSCIVYICTIEHFS